MVCRAQRPIKTDCLRDVPTFKRIMETLPKEARTCTKCGEEIIIHESAHLPNPGSAIPFAKATLVGCDTTIDNVIEGLAGRGINLNDCFESEKS